MRYSEYKLDDMDLSALERVRDEIKRDMDSLYARQIPGERSGSAKALDNLYKEADRFNAEIEKRIKGESMKPINEKFVALKRLCEDTKDVETANILIGKITSIKKDWDKIVSKYGDKESAAGVKASEKLGDVIVWMDKFAAVLRKI